MSDPIRVAVLGGGQMGSAIARLVGERQQLALVGIYSRSRTGTLLADQPHLETLVGPDLDELLARTRPDIAIQATCSRVDEALPEIRTVVTHGVNVVTIAEEMIYPGYRHPQATASLDGLAIAHGVSVLGTGINPGFVLDFLVVVLSGVCERVDSIAASRTNDLSPFGPRVLTDQGVGLSPSAFAQGVDDGRVTGHHGFEESIAMIADALGWTLDGIEQGIEPIVSSVRRETRFAVIEPGQVAGCRQQATGHVNGRPAIRLVHPQVVHPQLELMETEDRIELLGRPDIRLSGSPEIPGGCGTAALAVNVIPRVLSASPGLRCMADLPPPAARLGPTVRNRAGSRARGALRMPASVRA